MAKNYAAIYDSGNDSISLEQRLYLKVEGTRGQVALPTNSDFLYSLAGGGIEFSQPFESSPHRSGRHHNNTITKKTETSFSFSTYFNINEALGAPSAAEVDQPVRTLFKSLLGYEDATTGLLYDARIAPDLTFSLFEVGDMWSRQAAGCFVQAGNMQFPGDGEATVEWSGDGKTVYFAGVAKSTFDNNAGNVIALQPGEGDRFSVGAQVMLIEADGSTRSADTPAGSARTVTAKTSSTITVSGAVLADADGSVTPLYVCYYEPDAPTGIDNPITGLVGSFAIASLGGAQCVRSASVNIQNNHEKMDYCFGEPGLGGPLFTPADRLTAEVEVELNVNHETFALVNRIRDNEDQDLTLILGNAAGRHFEALMPRVIFSVPTFSVPETGTIPVTVTGNCYQTALDSADEVTLKFI
jgi:hypothetical protein